MAISSNGLAGLKPGVVDNTASRPSAPFEGQMIFQKDTDQLLVWNGTAWVIPNAPAQNPQGLELITTGALSGSATNFVGCFSSTYDNYKIVVQTIKVSGPADIYIRMLNGTTPLANSSYYYNVFGYDNNGTLVNQPSVGLVSYMFTGVSLSSTTAQASAVFDVMTPNLVLTTTLMGQSHSYSGTPNWRSKTFSCLQQDDTSFDGIRFATLSSETMTGTATIYGYRK